MSDLSPDLLLPIPLFVDLNKSSYHVLLSVINQLKLDIL